MPIKETVITKDFDSFPFFHPFSHCRRDIASWSVWLNGICVCEPLTCTQGICLLVVRCPLWKAPSLSFTLMTNERHFMNVNIHNGVSIKLEQQRSVLRRPTNPEAAYVIWMKSGGVLAAHNFCQHVVFLQGVLKPSSFSHVSIIERGGGWFLHMMISVATVQPVPSCYSVPVLWSASIRPTWTSGANWRIRMSS